MHGSSVKVVGGGDGNGVGIYWAKNGASICLISFDGFILVVTQIHHRIAATLPHFGCGDLNLFFKFDGENCLKTGIDRCYGKVKPYGAITRAVVFTLDGLRHAFVRAFKCSLCGTVYRYCVYTAILKPLFAFGQLENSSSLLKGQKTDSMTTQSPHRELNQPE